MDFDSRFTLRPATRNTTTYNRLVRDKIPEIIEMMGNIAVWRELDDEDFGQEVLRFLVRSSQQFAESESLESLSDVLEAVDAWLELRGLSMEEVTRARFERKKRCGGFEQRRFLQMVAGGADAESWSHKNSTC